MTRAIAWLCVAAIVSCAGRAAAATRYDPRLKFQTTSTARFDIHFHQGLEALAMRLARIVEQAASEVDAAIGPAAGRVHVILVDQHDLSNGWATPLPYNTIEISAATPPAESGIGNVDDWLRLVFVHEYTHIAHLSRAGGWIGGLRRSFGRLPILFPNLYQPIWAIEGMATWEESAATRMGRVPAGDFRSLVTEAAAAGRFERLDRVNGGNVDWPGGSAPYAYGAYFHDYLARRYGPATLRTLSDETGRRLPYLGSRAYKKVYGRSLGELWNEFRIDASARAEVSRAVTAVRLTRHGFTVGAPRFAGNGRVYYSIANPHRFPALMEIAAAGGEPREVAPRYLGNRIALAGERLVVDQVDLVRSVALQSDLYLVDPRDGRRQRLTYEARALDPDVAPDGTRAVCALQMRDRRALAIFSMSSPDSRHVPAPIVSEWFTDFSSPRWSPDGRVIAAERRRTGGPSEIVIVDPETRSVRTLANMPGGRSASPAWTPDGQYLIFASAVGSAPFQIFRVHAASGELARLEGTGASAQSPDISPDGRTLVFVGYTADGYDLFSMPLEGARWTPVPAEATGAAPSASPSLVGGGMISLDAATYSPRRTLLPQFWVPTLESDAGETVVGAATGSVDVLGRHAYGVEAGWGRRARPDWQVAYAYDRWRPTIFAAVADDTDPWRSGELRTVEADVGLLLRAARVRHTQTTFAAWHIANERLDCGTCAPVVDVRHRLSSARLGWEFTTARTFGYSISAEEGGRVRVTAELPRTAFGSDGNGVALTADARHYFRAGPKHAVVAIRGAAAGFWGDEEATRVFSASGHGPQPGGFAFGRDAIGLLRGVDDDETEGTRAAVLNVDYRAPLRRVDRGIGTIPVFFRAIHGAAFVDAGHAWDGRARWSDVRVSIGAELSVDTVVGFALPVTFSAGAAWRRDTGAGERGVAVFGRVGRAF